MRPLTEVFMNLTGKDIKLQLGDEITIIPAKLPAVAFDRASFTNTDVFVHSIRIDQPSVFKLTNELPPLQLGTCLLVSGPIRSEHGDRPDLFYVPPLRMTVLQSNSGGAEFLRLALEETEYIGRLREALNLLEGQPDTEAVRQEHQSKEVELKVALRDHYSPESTRVRLWQFGEVVVIGHPRWKHSWLIPGQAEIRDTLMGETPIIIHHDEPGYVALIEATTVPVEGAEVIWQNQSSKAPKTVLNIGARGSWTEQQIGNQPVRWLVENGTARVVSQ